MLSKVSQLVSHEARIRRKHSNSKDKVYWEKGPQLQSKPHPGVLPTTAWLPCLGKVTVFSVIWLPAQHGEKEACQSDGSGMREVEGEASVAPGRLLSPPCDGRFL